MAIGPLPRNLTSRNGEHGLKEKRSIGVFNGTNLANGILIPEQNVQLCLSSRLRLCDFPQFLPTNGSPGDAD